MTIAHPWADGPHGWRFWRDHPHMRLHWADLPGTLRAATDGTSNTWFDSKTLQVERRCDSVHEHEHVLAGHTSCVFGIAEARIRWRAARRLTPSSSHLADALIMFDRDLELVADHLWIDMPTMEARVDPRFMLPAERFYLHRRLVEELNP